MGVYRTGMDKEDARNQTLEQLHERRKQVVRLHNRGHKIMKIVAMTGPSYPTVRHAIDLYQAGGWSAIRPTARGRTPGQGRAFTAEQEHQIQCALINQRPEIENGFLSMEPGGGKAADRIGIRHSIAG
jgi:hypothetical protein